MGLLTPEQIASSGTEHSHQMALCQWVAIDGQYRFAKLNLLFAIPNGGDRRVSVAASLKAEGVKPGVPDLFLPVPARRYPGLFIEMKRPGHHTKANGARSDPQVEWHKELVAQGYATCVCYGWRAARLAIEQYYSGEYVQEGSDAIYILEPKIGD